ncbi:MAG: zinc-dependent alcohol dehydrogenase family protein [Pseudomonadota bacterium]
MRAAVLHQAGKADALRIEETNPPHISSPNQVLVRIKAAGINPVDTKMRQAPERFPLHMPAILGCDGAGIVEETGANVTRFSPGDEVYFCQCGFNGRQGTYAEYAAVDECFLAHKPKALTFAEAAAAPLVLITAWEALYDRVTVNPGQQVLIHAGAGGVGHVAIQLAKLAGARVATTVSSAAKAEFVKILGAEKVIRYKEQDFVQAIREWGNGNHGVDIALDTVGGPLIEKTFGAVRVYGDVVTILQPPPDINWGEARKRNLRFTQELMLSPTLMEIDEAKLHQGWILEQCAKLFEQNRLSIKVAKTFDLADVAKAHEYLENEHPIGKVVLMVS